MVSLVKRMCNLLIRRKPFLTLESLQGNHKQRAVLRWSYDHIHEPVVHRPAVLNRGHDSRGQIGRHVVCDTAQLDERARKAQSAEANCRPSRERPTPPKRGPDEGGTTASKGRDKSRSLRNSKQDRSRTHLLAETVSQVVRRTLHFLTKVSTL